MSHRRRRWKPFYFHMSFMNVLVKAYICIKLNDRMKNTEELMHCHCGTNNRAPRWTFTDPCKPEVRPGAREESASPVWLAAPAMNAQNTTKVYIWRLVTGCGPTLYRKCHSHNTPRKDMITLESNPSWGTVLPAPHGKGNKCDKNVMCPDRHYKGSVTATTHQEKGIITLESSPW